MSSLQIRITLTYLVVVIAAVSVLGVWVMDRIERDFHNSLEADLLADARVVGNLVRPLIVSGATPAELDAFTKQAGAETGTRITLIAADGVVLADSQADPVTMENHADRSEVQTALISREGKSRHVSETLGIDFSYVATRLDIEDGPPTIVRVARPVEVVDATLADTRDSLIVVVAIVTCLTVLAGAFLSRSILHPLAGLTNAASKITAGDQTARAQEQASGEVGALIAAFNQMADTVQQQMAAASQERGRLAAALNSSVDAVIAVNAQSNAVYANYAAERLFQRPASDIVGHPFAWTLPDDAVIAAMRASRERTESQATQIERPGRQYLQVVTTPIRGGGDWAVLVVFHDLTDVRRTDLIRRDFVANVGHELRTPLAAIKSVVDTLTDGAIDEPQVAREFLGRADAEVERLAQMVEELMELSRIESGVLPLSVAPANIRALLADAVNRLRPQVERKNITLKLEADPGIEFPLDARRMEHAIVNLVHNAIKFTPEGGTVTVSAECLDNALTLQVSDTGIGIATQDLSRIFERFYKVDQSRASTGSGLGLAVVKHTIEAHGGSVVAKSGPGPGSTFRITIPAQA